MTEKHSAYFRSFGIQALAYNDSNEVVGFKVIYDNEFQATQTIGSFEISSSQPVALVLSTDVANISIGNIIKINDIVYKINDKRPDTIGTLTTLVLAQREVQDDIWETWSTSFENLNRITDELYDSKDWTEGGLQG